MTGLSHRHRASRKRAKRSATCRRVRLRSVCRFVLRSTPLRRRKSKVQWQSKRADNPPRSGAFSSAAGVDRFYRSNVQIVADDLRRDARSEVTMLSKLEKYRNDNLRLLGRSESDEPRM